MSSSAAMDVVVSPAEAQPSRLMILKMQVENFKSYGGVKEIGPFHKCFSSVVGPNGSGKSNVIDAMLFVFGKKTAKLRLNKLSELIHKSAEYPDLDYARVTVFFQSITDKQGDEDAYDVVPGSHFTVSRSATKSNTSQYYLNGKASTFGEVTALLRQKGIDLDHNRFLILQGEVELISQMKPKATAPGEEGLLEYLEDIIGSNQYVEKIEEQAKAVELLTEQRADRIKRVQVAEKEKASLESAKAEAEALLSKDREILRAQGSYVQALLSRERTAASSAASTLSTKTGTRDGVRAQLALAEAAGAGLEGRLKAADAATSSAVATHGASKAALDVLEKRDAELKAELVAARAGVKKAEAGLHQHSDALAAAEKAGEAARASIPDLEAVVSRLEGEKGAEQRAHDDVMGGMKGESDALGKQLKAAEQELQPKAEAVQAAQSALNTTSTELRLLRERVESASREVAILLEQQGKLEKEAAARAGEKRVAQDELARAGLRKTAIASEMASAEEEEKRTGESLLVVRARLEEAKAAGAEGSAGSGRSPLADAMAKAAAKGGPLAKATLHGRLGGLGVIDDKYDAAVTTAVGALGNFVVDTVAGGQECVNWLRTNKAGRAKFIILEKVVPDTMGAMERGVTTPEGVPRLFDLIRPVEPRFKAAFYFAMRDTLVAESLEQARRIAFPKDPSAQRWRVVTLDGALLEMTGTMSGGGTAPRKGGMTTSSQAGKAGHHGGGGGSAAASSSVEDIGALEREVASLSATLVGVRARRKGLAQEAADLDRSLPKLMSRLTKLDMEIAGMAQMKEDKARLVADASSAAASARVSAADEALLKELTTRHATQDADLAAKHKDAAALELRAAALKRQVIEVGGEQMARAKARLERSIELLAAKEKELVKARAEAKASGAAAGKARAAMEKADKEGHEAADKHASIKQEILRLTSEAQPLIEKLKGTEARVVEETAGLEAVKAEVDAFAQGLRGLKKAKEEAEAAVGEAKEASDAAAKRVKTLTSRLEKFIAEYAEYMEAHVAEVSAQVADEEGLLPDGTVEGEEEMDDAGRARAATHLQERIRERVREPLSLPMHSEEELARIAPEKQGAIIAGLEAAKDELKAKVNMSAIKEYRAKEKEYLKRVAELEATTLARDTARRSYEQLRKARLDTFMDGFSKIGLKLKEMYQMITLGGDAELELEDSLDPFEGIRFSVRPPKKSWKAIANLSGGEKTLSSLALVFALHHYKPTPLYVMDEIDAALDFKNVSIVANYIKERTKNAQFIIISLRNNMFELADRLVGIYKTADVTKSVTINPKAIAAACGVLSGQENYATGGGAPGEGEGGKAAGAPGGSAGGSNAVGGVGL